MFGFCPHYDVSPGPLVTGLTHCRLKILGEKKRFHLGCTLFFPEQYNICPRLQSSRIHISKDKPVYRGGQPQVLSKYHAIFFYLFTYLFRLAWDTLASCIRFLSVAITGVYSHTEFLTVSYERFSARGFSTRGALVPLKLSPLPRTQRDHCRSYGLPVRPRI